jgi:ribosomal protein L7Ae-like RNA K-turn-binding protein
MGEAEPTLSVVLPYLHQARRSGSIAVGHQAVRRDLQRGRCKLILLATDAGGALKRMETGKVPVLTIGDKQSLGDWLDRREVSILGISDPHLAAGIMRRIQAG